MTAQALRNRWALPDEKKKVILESLMGIVESPESKDRERISAARALIAVEKQNQDDEFRSVAKPPTNHLHVHVDADPLAEKRRIAAELLSRLGITVGNGTGQTDRKPISTGS